MAAFSRSSSSLLPPLQLPVKSTVQTETVKIHAAFEMIFFLLWVNPMLKLIQNKENFCSVIITRNRNRLPH